ncbi:MAG: SH3 domain-containing protein [Pseudomonadota bacterium]
MSVRIVSLFLFVASLWQLGLEPVSAQQVQAARVSHISGKTVPRFESLRYDKVNGRAGPSLNHPIKWHYSREGLPVLILKETEGWRYVRDPAGDEVWVHERMLSPMRTAVTTGPTLMRVKPEQDARSVARLHEGVQLEILERGEDAVRVSSGRFRGWVDTDTLWGETER